MTQQHILAPDEPSPLAFAPPPLEQQIEWLDAVTDDASKYVQVYLACITQIGCRLAVEYSDRGRHLVALTPIESATADQDRLARKTRFAEHMDLHSMGLAVTAEVERRRQVIDGRPADLRAATAAVRGLLDMGFRLLLHPNRHLEVAGGPPDMLRDARTYEASRDAYHAYRNIASRKGASQLLERAVRMIGKEHAPSKIIVLEKAA